MNIDRSPPGLIVQKRDCLVLRELARHRLLSGEHVRHLVFPSVSVRMANRRLRLLAQHGFLERHYLPQLEEGLFVRSRRPLYSLTRQGLLMSLGADRVPAGSWPKIGLAPSSWVPVSHNLVATDLLVAVEAAARGRSVEVETIPEPELRLALSRARGAGLRFATAVLPDGAFALTLPGAAPASFCVEVVRAGAKAGNRSVVEKLRRYVALNREGFFSAVYGLQRLRGVLLVTTSPERARRLGRLGAALPYGKGLVFATSYERRTDFAMTFDPSTVLDLPLLCAGPTLSSTYSSTLIHLCVPPPTRAP